jgi:hypothetical protein
MIKLSNGSGANIAVYVSPIRTLPGGFTGYTDSYTHVETHDLGAIPDRVDIMIPGNTAESVVWYGFWGPYAQATDCDYGYNGSVGELGNGGASCYSKSSTQFKVLFQRSWSGQKVYFKAYIFDGINRTS